MSENLLKCVNINTGMAFYTILSFMCMAIIAMFVRNVISSVEDLLSEFSLCFNELRHVIHF